MQVGAFIFIDRNWESDKKVLSKMMDYFSDLNHKTQVSVFPINKIRGYFFRIMHQTVLSKNKTMMVLFLGGASTWIYMENT